MDVCGLAVHQVTYLDIWVRQVIIIIDSSYSSCLDACFGLLLWTPVFSCDDFRDVFLFDFHMICNSDSIRLDIRWHEIKVYRWGFPCLDYSFDVLVSWDRDLSVYNQSCLYQLYSGFPILWWLCHTRSYILHLWSNPPVLCTWYLCSSWLATWLCIILAWGVSLTPLDSYVQVRELVACGCPLLLIRVAQR